METALSYKCSGNCNQTKVADNYLFFMIFGICQDVFIVIKRCVKDKQMIENRKQKTVFSATQIQSVYERI